MTADDDVRLDKWLWAARFFTTRALAAEAVQGGKVHLNAARTKPARHVHVGDTLEIHRGEEEITLTVVALSDHRGPAPIAATLYAETPESIAKRAEHAAQRAAANAVPQRDARPSKRDRRAWARVTHRDR